MEQKMSKFPTPHRFKPEDSKPLRWGIFGAGKEARTPDLNLGKVALYQLSYSRLDDLEY